MSDPYAEMVEVMKEVGNSNKNPAIRIGIVTHVEETNDKLIDLTITMGDLPIDKKNIYISDHLLKEYKRKVRTDVILKPKVTGITNSTNDGGQGASSHSHELESLSISDSYLYTRDTLKVGDLVSVIPTEDGQMYFVMNRVVKL